MKKKMDEFWLEEYRQVSEDVRLRTRSMWTLLSIYLAIIGYSFFTLGSNWNDLEGIEWFLIPAGFFIIFISFYFLQQISAERKNWAISIKRLRELECILIHKENCEKKEDYEKRGRATGFSELLKKVDNDFEKGLKKDQEKYHRFSKLLAILDKNLLDMSQYPNWFSIHMSRLYSAFVFIVVTISMIIYFSLVLIVWGVYKVLISKLISCELCIVIIIILVISVLSLIGVLKCYLRTIEGL